jgi:hypothetical protein
MKLVNLAFHKAVSRPTFTNTLVYQNFINGQNHNDNKLIRRDDNNVSSELISWLSNCATDQRTTYMKLGLSGNLLSATIMFADHRNKYQHGFRRCTKRSVCFSLLQVQAIEAAQKTIDT